MARFSTTVRTDFILPVDPAEVWLVMTQPDLLADLAPAIAQITQDGDRSCWRLVGINAMGVSAAPSFTERMDFDHDSRRITFQPWHAGRGCRRGLAQDATGLSQGVP